MVKTAADSRSYGAVSVYQVMQLTTLSSTAHDAASTSADVESSSAAAPDADTDGQNETELQLKRAQVCHRPHLCVLHCVVNVLHSLHGSQDRQLELTRDKAIVAYRLAKRHKRAAAEAQGQRVRHMPSVNQPSRADRKILEADELSDSS